MRTKREILFDWKKLINEKQDTYMTEEEINTYIDIKENEEVLEASLIATLYDTIEIDGQLYSSLKSWYVFCDIVVRYDIGTGQRIWNNFVKNQFEIIEYNKYSAYMSMRGAGKSYVAFCLYPIYKNFLIEGFEALLISNIPRQVKDNFRVLKRIIDTNELLLEKKDTTNMKSLIWSQREIVYNKGYVRGLAIGTPPIGAHVNLVIADDILRDDQKYTDQYTMNYVLGSLMPTTFRKKGRMAVLGTAFHAEDLLHTLINDKVDKNSRPIGNLINDGRISAMGFFSKIFPGILNHKTKKVLVPEIWTYDKIIALKKTMGELRWYREIMCVCAAGGSSLIPYSLFRSCCDSELKCKFKGEQGKKYAIIVDSATSDSPTADWAAITVWELGKDVMILRHLWHEKGYPVIDPDGGTDDQIHVIYRLHKEFNNAEVVVEKNNAGITIIQGLQAKKVDVIDHSTQSDTATKSGKSTHINRYIQAMKDGKVKFPSNPEDDYTLNCLEKVKNEHINFGVKIRNGKEVLEALAGHDDILDTCYINNLYFGSGDYSEPDACVIGVD